MKNKKMILITVFISVVFILGLYNNNIINMLTNKLNNKNQNIVILQEDENIREKDLIKKLNMNVSLKGVAYNTKLGDIIMINNIF
jgi:hypothetical protein